MKQIFIIAFFGVLLFGCNTKENNSSLENNNETSVKYPNLSNDLKDKPKLFLKFWKNMTKQEFDTVSKILVNEKILELENYASLYYLTPKCRVKLNPTFENDSLQGIELSNANCLYELYKEKYNLPEFSERAIVQRRYIDKNPEYNPSMSYISDKGEVKLPECFIDKSSYSVSGKQTLPIDESEAKEKVLPKSPIVIKKDDNVIIFRQTFYEIPSPTITYSLQLNPEMKKFQDEKPLSSVLEYGKFISKNSKYKIEEILSSSVITITYKSLENYNKNIDKESERNQILKQKLEREKQEKQKRIESVKNEL